MKLDNRIRELIAVGAAIGGNCHNCLRYHAAEARALGVPDHEIAEAIAVGRTVRQGAQDGMDKFARALLNAQPAASPEIAADCGCDGADKEAATENGVRPRIAPPAS